MVCSNEMGSSNIFRTDLESLVSFAKTGAALAPKDVAF